MKRQNNILLKEEFEDCKLCGNLQKLDYDCMLQKGRTPFIIIGESPAKDGWIESHKAFYNKNGKLQGSGRILSKLLAILNINIDDINFTECCKCVIQDRKALDLCSNNCKHFLFKQLDGLVDCDIIITLGLHPTQILLNKKIARFSDFVGRVFNIEINSKKFKLIPIYHPSPVNPKGYKNNVAIFEMINDMLINTEIKEPKDS